MLPHVRHKLMQNHAKYEDELDTALTPTHSDARDELLEVSHVGIDQGTFISVLSGELGPWVGWGYPATSSCTLMKL